MSKRGVVIFRSFNWHRHSELFNSKLAELVGKHDRDAAFRCLKQNAENHFNGNGKSTEFIVQYADQLVEEYEDLLTDDEFTLSCYLTLLLSNKDQSSSKYKEKFVSLLERMALRSQHMYRSSLDWKWPLVLPIHIRSIAEHLLLSVLNSPIQLELDLVSDFSTSLSQCQVKAVFRPMSVDVLQPLEPTFYSSTITDNICRFACVSKGGETASSSSHVDDYLVLTSQTDCHLVGNGAVSRVQLEGKAIVPGCFALDHLEVTTAKALTFHLHYQKEMVRGGSRLENVLCLVDIKKPWVVMEPTGASTQFLAGVVQKMCFRVHTGTMAMDSPSPLKFCLVGLKPLMEFMTEDGRWEKELNVQVVPLDADQSQLVEVFMCLAIDRMNFSADQSSLLHHEVQVDWVGRSWHFPLTFLPIVSLRSMTSLLGDRVLFELDIQRCDTNRALKLVPIQAKLLQDQSLAKEPVEARLMNPVPFEPLLGNSSYRIVWTLPNSKIGKTIPIVHYLQLDYKLEIDEDCCNQDYQDEQQLPLEHITQRQYCFENKLSFAVHKVEYEVCAQVLCAQSVLCRLDVQCDLIVSLRSLTNKAQSIIVVLEVENPHYWLAVDRFKVVNVKESGVGQTSFSIIPKKVGFLPYPSLFIHQHLDSSSNDRRSFSEQTMFGERLTSFHRNQGKQIHVLGPLLNSDDTSSSGSGPVKKSFKLQAKDRIQKLFE
uniref:Trafficking protein particle complex subunit 10 n=1 Tax=Ditylenchus dipsaci TaxID=166011 RepID=A0A915DSA6_9BILA